MVIAGGRDADNRAEAARIRFNGAGDGDRRRALPRRLAGSGWAPASTEPAMVIAGGDGFVYVTFGDGLLQRSRRW